MTTTATHAGDPPRSPRRGALCLGQLQHIQILEVHAKEECRCTDKRTSGASDTSLTVKTSYPSHSTTPLPAGPLTRTSREESKLPLCCRRSTKREDQCQACPGVAEGEAGTPPPNPTPITQVWPQDKWPSLVDFIPANTDAS